MKNKIFTLCVIFIAIFSWQLAQGQTLINEGSYINVASYDTARFVRSITDPVKYPMIVTDTMGYYDTKIKDTQTGDYFIYAVQNWEAKDYCLYLKVSGDNPGISTNVDFFDTKAAALDLVNNPIDPLLTQAVFTGAWTTFVEKYWTNRFANARATTYMRIYIVSGSTGYNYGSQIMDIRCELYDPKIHLNRAIGDANSAKALLFNYVTNVYRDTLNMALDKANEMFGNSAFDRDVIMGITLMQDSVMRVCQSLINATTKLQSHILFYPAVDKNYVLIRTDSSFLYGGATDSKLWLNKYQNLNTNLRMNIPDLFGFDQAKFDIQRDAITGKYSAKNVGTGKWISSSGSLTTLPYLFNIAYAKLIKDQNGVNQVYFALNNFGGKYLDAGGSGYTYGTGAGNSVGTYGSGIPAAAKCLYRLLPVDKPTYAIKAGLRASYYIVDSYLITAETLYGRNWVSALRLDTLYEKWSNANDVLQGDSTIQTQEEVDFASTSLDKELTAFKNAIKFKIIPEGVFRISNSKLITNLTYNFKGDSILKNATVKAFFNYRIDTAYTTADSIYQEWRIYQALGVGEESMCYLKNLGTGKLLGTLSNGPLAAIDSLDALKLTYVKEMNQMGYFGISGLNGNQNLDNDGTGLLIPNGVAIWGSGTPGDKSLYTIIFKRTQTDTNPPVVGLPSNQSAIFNVYARNGRIFISGRDQSEAKVYSLTGSLIYKGKVSNNSISASFNPGMYILKVGNTAVKVMVK